MVTRTRQNSLITRLVMADALVIEFASLSTPLQPTAAVLCGQELVFGPQARELNQAAKGALLQAAQAADFKGKSKTSFELLAQPQLDVKRLLVIGVGSSAQAKETDWVNLGGYIRAADSAKGCRGQCCRRPQRVRRSQGCRHCG